MRAGRRALAVQLLLVFVAWTAAVAQQGENELVIGRQETVRSSILGEDRVIMISLPEGYENSGALYPVLYVLDAEMPALYDDAVNTVADAAEADTVPEMIVVGIRNTIRDRDMIPAAVAHRPGSGGSGEFLRFIAEELMPHIDREYRTDSRNALFGGSNAGLFTVFAILQRPDIFFAGIAASPMIGHTSEFMYRLAGELRHLDRFEGRALYMIYGEHDAARCTEYVAEFKDYMDTVSLPLRMELVMVPNGGHVPPTSLNNGLRYVFAAGEH